MVFDERELASIIRQLYGIPEEDEAVWEISGKLGQIRVTLRFAPSSEENT